MAPLRFVDTDFCDSLLAPGRYPATIVDARLGTSSAGNRMLVVQFELALEPAGAKVVADYFVLEGVSERGLRVARARLVELYRACGCVVRSGDEILPDALVGCALEVSVEQQERDERLWLRVTGYRVRGAKAVADDRVPF